MDNLLILAFGTFGHPNDFRQTVFGTDQNKIGGSVKTFDLNINAIKIFPGGKLYALRKEIINGLSIISYSLYTFAKEQNSDREGTFIGSSFVFINDLPEENFILNKLNEFHNGLIKNNLSDQTLKVKHSQDFKVPAIADLDKFSFNTRPTPLYTDFKSTGSNLLLLTRLDSSTLIKNLKSSLDLLNLYDVIFFTDDVQIAEFVRNKRIYSAVDEAGFENELKKFDDLKKKKIQDAIDEIEKEKAKVNADNNKISAAFAKTIETNLQMQSSNAVKIEEAKINLLTIQKLHDDYIQYLNAAIQVLKTNPNSVDSTQNLKLGKTNFESQKAKLQQPKNITAFPQSSTLNASNAKTVQTSQSNIDYDKPKKLDLFKIISFLLNLALIGVLLYLIFFTFKKQEQLLAKSQNTLDSIQMTDEISDINLNPLVNDSLSSVEIATISQKLDSSKNISQVVDVLFESNPQKLGLVYKYQKKDYMNLLLEKNPNSFRISSDTIYSPTDSLRIVPSFTSK